MASMRRTAANEEAKVVERTRDPHVVVHDPSPRAHPEQRWTVQSYPFYEPLRAQSDGEEPQ